MASSKKGTFALPATFQTQIDDPSLAADIASFAFGPDANDSTLVQSDTDDGTVLRRGMIFRAGDYPDKDFSLSPKELRHLVKTFQGPIDLDSEHERSIFDGKLGSLVSVEANEDGTILHGLVSIPRWLDPILMAAGGKVSAAFDRATKTLVGLALTINPRVTDAALMAAFTVDESVHGAASVEEVIDMAGKSDKKLAKQLTTQPIDAEMSDDESEDDSSDGAAEIEAEAEGSVGYNDMLPATTPPVTASNHDKAMAMAIRSGRGMMQSIHDVTAARGAGCQVELRPGATIGPYGTIRYDSKPEMDVLQTIHDTTIRNGATCVATLTGQQTVPGGTPWTWQWPEITSEGHPSMPGSTKAPPTTDQEPGSNEAMKAFAKFMESLDKVDPRYNDAQVQTPSRTQPASDSSDSRRLDEENARLREENRQMRMQGILDRAVSFADKMLQEGHATPIEREGIITVHAQLEHDDTFTAKATFSNGMSRVAAYEASLLARPTNLLQAELLPASIQAGLIKFANMTETPKIATSEYGKMTEERKRQLTNLDPVLKKAFDDTRANGRAK